MVGPAPSPRATRTLLVCCFFLSGGAALVYEVLWSRHLHLIFGSTTESVAAVLATFMAGLGLGGHVLGRLADRSPSPMRLYGMLEIGIGLYAFLTEPLLVLARILYSAATPHLATGGTGATLVKLLLAAIVLVPPATLMGGTLPALLRATAVGERGASAEVGLLYALNTLGAVAGTLLTGFLLIEAVGLSTTMRLTAVTNLGIGLLVVARARRHAVADSPPVTAPAHRMLDVLRALVTSSAGRYALLGLFTSGATTMLYEVIFTRVLGLVFGVSSYAFTIVLAVFLVGLALGALAAHRWARQRPPEPIDFALSQLSLAVIAALAIALVPSVPRLMRLARQLPEPSFALLLWAKIGIALVVLLPLAWVAGIGLPLLLAALTVERARAGRLVGDAYMVNTAGTLAGSLLAGFVLIERLGTQGSLELAAFANLAVGVVGLAMGSRTTRLWLAGAPLAVIAGTLAWLTPKWPAATFILSDSRPSNGVATTRFAFEQDLRLAPREVMFFAEGREATVAVTRSGVRTLHVNGHPDASDAIDMATQLLLAVVPLTIHPHPEEVAVVGFGSGVTASAAARVPEVRHVDVIELERAVLDASPAFHHVNHDVEHDPKVTLIRDDARSFLAAPRHPYDAIISEPSNPWRAGVASLFTTDFYAQARAALKPGGVFAQWVQLYSIDAPTLQLILRTMMASFPQVQAWWLDAGDIVVLGSDLPLPVARERVTHIVGDVFGGDLRRWAQLRGPDELYGRFLLAAEHGAGSPERTEFSPPVNTDDLPLLEFQAPRGLARSDGQNALRMVGFKLEHQLMLPPVAGELPPEAAVWAGVATIYRAASHLSEARAALDRALAAGGRTALLLAESADVALEEGDLRAADALLDEARGRLAADGGGPSSELVEELTAGLRMRQGRMPEAVAAFARAGDLDGRVGVTRLRALASAGLVEDAYAQADRLLSHAALGAEVQAVEVEQVLTSLRQVATRAGDPERAIALVEKYPQPEFASFAREKALAILCEQAHRPADALAHALAALAGGALDLGLMEIEARDLAALGRVGEALAVDRARRALVPSAPVEKVPAPLLERSGTAPAAAPSYPDPLSSSPKEATIP